MTFLTPTWPSTRRAGAWLLASGKTRISPIPSGSTCALPRRWSSAGVSKSAPRLLLGLPRPFRKSPTGPAARMSRRWVPDPLLPQPAYDGGQGDPARHPPGADAPGVLGARRTSVIVGDLDTAGMLT